MQKNVQLMRKSCWLKKEGAEITGIYNKGAKLLIFTIKHI